MSATNAPLSPSAYVTPTSSVNTEVHERYIKPRVDNYRLVMRRHLDRRRGTHDGILRMLQEQETAQNQDEVTPEPKFDREAMEAAVDMMTPVLEGIANVELANAQLVEEGIKFKEDLADVQKATAKHGSSIESLNGCSKKCQGEIAGLKSTVAKQAKKIQEQEGTINRQESIIKELSGKVTAQEATIKDLTATVAKQAEEMKEQREAMKKQQLLIENLVEKVAGQEKTIKDLMNVCENNAKATQSLVDALKENGHVIRKQAELMKQLMEQAAKDTKPLEPEALEKNNK